ncbi:MAG: hypothetical protein A3B47_02570 [Candidatus Levybacteria bacterium RIFCSPLOWO2_01_FULL_39_24]|nr:MAG: hypothetical protein A2800_01860 [Candidatus Levybacteria bacterium RIFCSPHIGHO2_01_FULL_40_16]OGH28261.1 MAG: hypothetical protein A3E12_01990 [Candidatus Levybacteria bacterium RIFCSPHIGHO2_12_FULL_39_9]OGH46508.1 MAG: hypothetical protein A3B47_02570 [Candidatus Levybacteria bacterium RIFCSPLOWO2_01_FULL_39_24]
MTISSEKTGSLYLNSKTFQIEDRGCGLVNLEVIGYTQGMGGVVKAKTGMAEETIHVGPCSKVLIFGEEFWREYLDHPKRQITNVSLIYPEVKIDK